MELQPKSREEIQSIVQDAIQDAVDFVESEISDERLKAQRYYDGEVDIGYEEGRSKVVATKVRDTVRAVKPSIMRVFMSTTKPVEYVPKGPEDVALAEQATSFMHHEFQRLNGYRVLNDAIHDALVKKQGIVKTYFKRYPKAKIYTFSDLSEDELTLLTADPDVQVLEQEMEMRMQLDEFGMDVEAPVWRFELRLDSRQHAGPECRDFVCVAATKQLLQLKQLLIHLAGECLAPGVKCVLVVACRLGCRSRARQLRDVDVQGVPEFCGCILKTAAQEPAATLAILSCGFSV